MANTVDHTHGDNGDKPVDGLNFQNGDVPDPEVFDWFWTEVPSAINNHAQLLEQIDSDGDGVVDRADVADSADTVKGNDIDSDGDGKVNAAETADNADTASGLTNVSHSELTDAPDSAHHTRYTDAEAEDAAPVQTVNGQTGDVSITAESGSDATSYKGNDIDSDGDGKVDSAEVADDAKGLTNVSHSELDGITGDDHHSRYTDSEAESAAPVQSVNGKTGAVTVDTSGGDATSYKGNDIDSDGDGKVNSADVADEAKGLNNVSHSELTDAPDNAHHSRYTDSEAQSAAQSAITTVPSGGIIMWSGSVSNVPSGWTLCDGSDGAPDLRDRFIVGAGNQYTEGETGGEDEHQLTVGEMPSHNHDIEFDKFSDNQGVKNLSGSGGGETVTESNRVKAAGGNEAHENRPPFYALAFIYKL